jgi:hypothetical protein
MDFVVDIIDAGFEDDVWKILKIIWGL